MFPDGNEDCNRRMDALKVPNGLGPIPDLDVSDDASLGHFLDYGVRLSLHIYTAQEALKDQVAALAGWQGAREKERNIQQGRDEERAEQRERGEKRLGRWKLRAETVAAIGGAAVFCGGLGIAAGKFVF